MRKGNCFISITQKSIIANPAGRNAAGLQVLAAVTGTATITGKVGSDAVNVIAGTAAFDTKNVGTNKSVTFAGYSQSVPAPPLKGPYTGPGVATVKYNGSDRPPVYPGEYAITLDIAAGANFDAVDFRAGIRI